MFTGRFYDCLALVQATSLKLIKPMHTAFKNHRFAATVLPMVLKWRVRHKPLINESSHCKINVISIDCPVLCEAGDIFARVNTKNLQSHR